MAIINGTVNNDTLNGTANVDTIDFSQGGSDAVNGGGSDDTLIAGGALDATDTINGGIGSDVLDLAGNYAGGIVFGANTLTNVEKIRVASGFSYNLTTHDNTVAAGQLLTIDGYNMTAGKSLVVNGSAETDGSFL